MRCHIEGDLIPFASLTPAASGSRHKALRTIIANAILAARGLTRLARSTHSITLAALLLAQVVLSGCGFEPVYGQQARSGRAHQLESITVAVSNDTQSSRRVGQLLQSEIEDQINPSALRAEKAFLLAITIVEQEVPLLINPDGTASRGDMQYTTNYVLTRKRDGLVIDSGHIDRVSSYNISGAANYMAYVSREDARKRSAVELARDYHLRLVNVLPAINGERTPRVIKDEPAAVPIISPRDTHENRRTGY